MVSSATTFQEQLARAAAAADTVAGWMTRREGELLFGLAAACPPGGAIVEIGSWKGRSTAWLGMGAMLTRGVRVFAVDPHEPYLDDPDGSLGEFLANLQRLNLAAVVTSVVERSETAAATFDEAIDVLFIDGDHSEERVLADFAMWQPKVKDGGKIAFHDVRNLTSPGVSRALSRVLWSSTQVADVRLVDSIVLLTRVDAAPLADRVRNMSLAVILRAYSTLAGLPEPLVAMGRRLLALLSTESGR